jgi:hypothetical protein
MADLMLLRGKVLDFMVRPSANGEINLRSDGCALMNGH